MQFLRQSTAVTVKIGPFIDDTDGKTAETALTITQADVRLSKNGGDIAQKNESSDCTHDELGIYNCSLDATDTNTAGRLQLWVHKSGALPVWHEYMVLPANVYDSLFGSDKLEVDIVQIGGEAQSASDLKDFADSGYDPSTHKIEGCKVNDDMRGTDNAALASVCTEARLAELDAANIPSDIDTLLSRLTATRANYLDNLSEGPVALASVCTETRLAHLDADISSRSSHSAADVWSVDTRSLTDKAGFSLSDAGVDDIFEEVVEDSTTFRQMLRIIFAALAGKSSGGGTTTVRFRDIADTKDRITATVDSDGNRTAITLDGT
ncbi:hypothetical protein DRN97_05065 [Methanosarcinales archaeon]|mgnify:CR=1 FL=1|nr:MAG: hypothetical protein DRN97_05065 [Methanosarcinales archaeon]